MREIKFRSKSLVTNTWVFGYYTQQNDQAVITTIDSVIDVDPKTVSQYTGLKDKNGVEIYEGDILSMAGSITGAEGLNPGFFFDEEDKVEIAWDNDIAAWSVAGKLDMTDRVEVTYRNHVIQLIHQSECEVIGNIYENPELLK